MTTPVSTAAATPSISGPMARETGNRSAITVNPEMVMASTSSADDFANILVATAQLELGDEDIPVATAQLDLGDKDLPVAVASAL